MTESFESGADSGQQPRRTGAGRPLWPNLWLAAALALYLAFALFQLGLPGLHYDEAREAGLNALELLTDAPVTAFRDASLTIAGIDFPLMVQDYIGALNVYLALPFLAATGVGVPNLRIVSVLIGLATLLTLERALAAWMAIQQGIAPSRRAPIAAAGLIAVTLLAASPNFVFWSRQGIFVTNLTQPLTLLCIWQGLRWWRTGRASALWLSAFAGGLALYAKLLAIWVIAPFAVLIGGGWIVAQLRSRTDAPNLSIVQAALTLTAFVVPLLPLLLFNVQTGGTVGSVSGNLRESYYGVNNLAIGSNLLMRSRQAVQVLRGDNLWYLGGIYANPLAPWAALLAGAGGLWRRPRWLAAPLALLGMSVGLSLFTVSDLFITHYALLQPLLVGTVAIAFSAWLAPIPAAPALTRALRWGAYGLISLWLLLDLNASLNYHRALQRTGGLADHSDAGYHLAYYLRYNGLGAPIALDWGMDAPIRFLTEGTVRPIEIFGYASLAAPDSAFDARLDPFLPNPDNVYLLHAPDQTVFAGRREAFVAAAAAQDLIPVLQERFRQRNGVILFEVWRVVASP